MNDQQVPPSEPTVVDSPQMGMLGRFIALFTDPRKAFESVRKNYEWVVALLLVAAVVFTTVQLTKPIIKKDMVTSIEEQLEQFDVPAERRQEIIDNALARMDNPLWQLLTPVFLLVVLFIGTGILLFLGNIIMGGEARFGYLLNMFALTWLITIPENIIKVPLMISKGSTNVATSLALFLPVGNESKFIETLLGKFDLFGLWQLTLVIIGMSVLCKSSTTKAAWTVGIAWFIWVLIQSGLASLGIQMGGM